MRRATIVLLIFAACGLGPACAAKRPLIPPGTVDADQFLFQRGEEEFKQKHWLQAREYYRQIVDNYPQSTYRPDSKLAVGDTYIGEDSTESLVLAVNEFREFLTFYPTNPRADYAQYRLAYAYSQQMLAPDRDQTPTREVVKELQVFLDRYPNSALMPEAKKLMREGKDRLSQASYLVGYHYYRVRWYKGATERFKEILKNDPEFTNRDAVYFYMAESLVAESLLIPDKEMKQARLAEALPYYERLLGEFEQSDYLERARKRVAELKAGTS